MTRRWRPYDHEGLHLRWRSPRKDLVTIDVLYRRGQWILPRFFLAKLWHWRPSVCRLGPVWFSA